MNPWILSKPPQENGERKVVGYDKTLLEVIKKLCQLTSQVFLVNFFSKVFFSSMVAEGWQANSFFFFFDLVFILLF